MKVFCHRELRTSCFSLTLFILGARTNRDLTLLTLHTLFLFNTSEGFVLGIVLWPIFE